MGFLETLRRNRRQLDVDFGTSDERRFFSPALYLEYTVTLPFALERARGRILDVGAGFAPFRTRFAAVAGAAGYETLETDAAKARPDHVGRIEELSRVLPAASYDTVLLFGVLEHVASPLKGLQEVHHVLAPGGRVILSVPLLARLHEEPHDYFRFTSHGVRALLEQSGFTEIEIRPEGGLASFLGHQLATILVCSFWHVPGLGRLMFSLNKWLVTLPAVWLDRRLDSSGKCPEGYVASARKG